MEADDRTSRGWTTDGNRTAVGWLSIFIAVARVPQAAKYLLHGFNKRRTLLRKGRFQGRFK